MSSERPPDDREGLDHTWKVVAGAVILGGVLRLWAASSRSLWLDEFHSRFHALADGPAALLSGLAVDNHPPGSFLVLQMWSIVAGEGQIALRLPAVVYGVLTVWLAARAAARLSPTRPGAAAGVAGVVVAASGLAVLLGAEVRMYSLLALCVIGVLEAVIGWCVDRRDDPDAPLPWRTALFVALGLVTHYWFLHHLALLGLVALVGILIGAGPRWRPRDLAPLAMGLVIASPWYATGFREQLTGHDLWPGGSGVSLAELAQSYLLLLFFNLGTLPTAAKLILAAAGAGLLALGVLGAIGGLQRSTGPARTALLAVGATALLLGPWGAVVATAFPRAGFNWNYLVGAIPALAILIGLGAARLPDRLRLVAVAPLLACLVAGAVTQASSPGTENLRGAVEHVLATAEAGDAVLPVEWQPPFFPHGQAWRFYAADRAEHLLILDHGEHYELVDLPAQLPARVHVVRRGLPLETALLAQLAERYEREDAAPFGYGVSVQTFSEPGAQGP